LSSAPRFRLSWVPSLTLAVFLIPVSVGLAGTWLPAFGWFPALDQYRFSLRPWYDLFAYPGFFSATQLTLITGLGSALLALTAMLLMLMAFYPSRLFRRLERWLAPVLSVPHAAFAIGLGFLITPSGWLMRLFASLTGMPDYPPNWLTFQDPWGISLMLVLALKETPFLLFMALASLPSSGQRWRRSLGLRPLASTVLGLGAVAYGGALLVLILWSLAGPWRFPQALPKFDLSHWQNAPEQLGSALWLTLSTGLCAALIALVLVMAALENEVRLNYQRRDFNAQRLLWLLYLPLLVPQIAFLFGFQVTLLWFNLDRHWWVLVWSHLVFVLPYTFLTLSGPYRAFDDRYSWLAQTLSGSRWQAWWRIKLGMLWRPIGYTLATGFAVSVAQYLPTLFIGGGRFATLTTEAVSLASGSDRRTAAVYALAQQGLPLLGFALAALVVGWRYRRHRDLQQGGS